MVHPAQMSTRNRCLRTSIQVRNHQVVLRALKIDLKISLRNGEARKEFNITGILGGYFPRGRDKSIETSPGFRSATIPSGIQWQPTFESPSWAQIPHARCAGRHCQGSEGYLVFQLSTTNPVPQTFCDFTRNSKLIWIFNSTREKKLVTGHRLWRSGTQPAQINVTPPVCMVTTEICCSCSWALLR